jgi:hypothetical protein
MAVTLQRETTEYVYFGFTGNVPSVGAETAFLAAGLRPTTEWTAAIVVNNNSHPLWDDAVASGIAGDYYIARLIGAFGGTGVVLTPGDYQPWVRLTDTVERPVRIAPVVVTIA